MSISVSGQDFTVEVTEELVSVVSVGIQGPPGPPPTTYVHTQSVPSSVWTITHGLDKYPSVSVVDSAGSVIHANVSYTSLGQCVVTFSAAFGGSAYLN